MKYLGIDIDSKLDWNNHIDRRCRTISPQIGLLRRLRKIIPTESLPKYYMATQQSHIDYCLTVWGFTSNKNIIDKIFKIVLHQLSQIILTGTLEV